MKLEENGQDDDEFPVAKMLPLKQGLKLPISSAISNATTPVAKMLPLKQGLKHIYYPNVMSAWFVAKMLPLKQGLKPSIQVLPSELTSVEEMLPLKQGLKRNGYSHNHTQEKLQRYFH